MTSLERARAYLDKMDPGISGQGGHNATFAAACKLREFGLSELDAWDLLQEFNARCQPAWSESDLRHKLRDAFERAEVDPRKVGNAPAPYRNGSNTPTASRKQYISQQPRVAPPAPRKLPEPIRNGAAMLLSNLFGPEEGVRIARGVLNKEGRECPEDEGLVLTAEQWIQRIEDAGGDANVGLFEPIDGCGLFITVNPMRPGGSKDGDVTDFRHTLLEWDEGLSLEEQYGVIRDSEVPVAAIIYSGGKSIHAWVRVDAKDRREFDERTAELQRQFEQWRPDPKNKNPSRFSRLPECTRHGKRQALLALGPIGAPSWSEWIKTRENLDLGPCHTIPELLNLDTTNDPNCVIGFRDGKTLRYLCKGKSAWILGPSGIGKSSLICEFAIGWALGQPVFGIHPARPLRSLIIQAENDRHDLAEMVQGIVSAHELDEFAENATFKQVASNVLFKTETSSVGAAFVGRLHRLIDRDRPDIVWIDPLLSFAGVDVNKQDQVTQFLRAELNPVLESTGCVLIGVHHTGKPRSANETKGWTPIDWAYSGLGSSELVNWARAVMMMRPDASAGGVYELKLAKRGPRAGARHPGGEPAWTSVWIRHARGKIRWEQCEAPVEAPAKEASGNRKKAEAVGGRPSKIDEILALDNLKDFLGGCLPEGETQNEIATRLESWLAKRHRDVSTPTCIRVVTRLVEGRKLAKTEAKKYVLGENK